MSVSVKLTEITLPKVGTRMNIFTSLSSMEMPRNARKLSRTLKDRKDAYNTIIILPYGHKNKARNHLR